jgi:porphobilinogen synthase
VRAGRRGVERALTRPQGRIVRMSDIDGPVVRPRRLRTTPALRRLVAETRLHPADLVLPLFVREGAQAPTPIPSMPGVVQHDRGSFRRAVADAATAGLGGVMLFGVPARRDAIGSGATDPDGVLSVAIRDAVAEAGDALVVMADLCLDEFTDHGHCGVLADDGSVDNDATLERYAAMATVLADAGADVVGTSGMMDGQVARVREALDDHGASNTVILAYAAKYASAFYGPFRDAVDSQLVGDRRTYQQDPANARESLREVLLDVDEGADIVMVKPAGTSLDVLRDIADEVDVPVAAYQVSGEFAMIEAAAAAGWIDRDAAVLESLVAIKRAGAGIIVTYFAQDAALLLR